MKTNGIFRLRRYASSKPLPACHACPKIAGEYQMPPIRKDESAAKNIATQLICICLVLHSLAVRKPLRLRFRDVRAIGVHDEDGIPGKLTREKSDPPTFRCYSREKGLMIGNPHQI